jgi:hypothetical protein
MKLKIILQNFFLLLKYIYFFSYILREKQILMYKSIKYNDKFIIIVFI